MSDFEPRDWAAIFAEVKAGVLSKGEICRRYNISYATLDKKLAANGIAHGSLLSRVEATVRSHSAQVSLLSDEEIVNSASQRSTAIVKSHLTLTRSLEARLALLIEGYDDMVHDAMSIDDDGNKTLDPKKWTQAAVMLGQLTKTADRLTQMELRTFGVSAFTSEAVNSASTNAAIENMSDDAMEASMVYQCIIQGTE